jgi:hypothetical protein
VRAENFRRMMAMGAIGTQLRKAFTSGNVLRSVYGAGVGGGGATRVYSKW